MRIRIHADVAKLVDEARKGKRSANAEVNMALVAHYASGASFVSGPLKVFKILKKK